ncbi:MAG: ATP12 chaperone family protein [Alphaproteobacteria bacterium]|nr:ATP12 chaperone family protein [Alphaproteobacteria bacterium]
MKRFYKMVTTGSDPSGYTILLDGQPVKAPSGKILAAPCEALAQAIMQEWAGQETDIVPDSMPLTQILTTRIDRVSHEREAMSAALLKYLDTDLLCYRTDHPPALAQAQDEAWSPWLGWFERRFSGALETTTGLRALRQDEALAERIRDHVQAMDDDAFTVFQLVTALGGSIVLALAFMEGELSPAELFEAIRVEERWKAALYDEERYGPDPMQARKDESAQTDLAAAQLYLRALKS